MKIKIILFVFGFLTWILLSWSWDIEHALTGIIVGIVVSYVSRDVFEGDPRVFKRASRYLWFLYYVLLFIRECIKANIDGVFRVAHPSLPINPGIVKVKTTLRSDIALTLLSNSLTLKPGTMTVDIDKENGFLYVHWVDVKTQDVQQATELIIGKFEAVLKRIFE
jgi:multicomponent Na+:H+ antiporter subunit E